MIQTTKGERARYVPAPKGEPVDGELVRRLRHFKANQLRVGDEYGAEVLHRAAEALERRVTHPSEGDTHATDLAAVCAYELGRSEGDGARTALVEIQKITDGIGHSGGSQRLMEGELTLALLEIGGITRLP